MLSLIWTDLPVPRFVGEGHSIDLWENKTISATAILRCSPVKETSENYSRIQPFIGNPL